MSKANIKAVANKKATTKDVNNELLKQIADLKVALSVAQNKKARVITHKLRLETTKSVNAFHFSANFFTDMLVKNDVMKKYTVAEEQDVTVVKTEFKDVLKESINKVLVAHKEEFLSYF